MAEETKRNNPLEDVQRLADEFRVKAHLASMDAKTAWDEDIRPRLQKLESQFDKAVDESKISEEVSKLEKRLRKLVEDVND